MSQDQLKPGILFVDDEELSRKYFKRFFGRTYIVFCAVDGMDGIATYEAHRDEIGIVVSDQMMPKMTGLELLEHLRQENAPVVRILSTAYAESADVEAAVASSLLDFFLTKPWDLPGLEKTLGQAEIRLRELLESAA